MARYSLGVGATLVPMARGVALPRLREWRIKRGYTQEGLAQATNGKVGLATVNRLERLPEAPAEVRTAKALAETLGIEIADLLERE